MTISPNGYLKFLAVLLFATTLSLNGDADAKDARGDGSPTSAASASTPANEEKIAAAVKVINKDAVVHSIRDVPGLGLKEVTANNSVVYMDPEGRYLFFGTLLDLQEKKNLSELAQARARILALQSIPDSEKIVYKPTNVRHRVTVFTDISCHFCQQLHKHIAEYNDLGIEVDYVAFPRGGDRNPAWAQMQSIWCAGDRKKAFDEAMAGGSSSKPAGCDDPVKSHYDLGESLNIEGTPAIYTENGKYIGGFLSPEKMLMTLESDKQSTGAQATASAAGAR